MSLVNKFILVVLSILLILSCRENDKISLRDNGVGDFDISPDGKKLIFDIYEDGKSFLVLMNIENKNLDTIYYSSNYNYTSPVFVSNDSIIYIQHNLNKILYLNFINSSSIMGFGSSMVSNFIYQDSIEYFNHIQYNFISNKLYLLCSKEFGFGGGTGFFSNFKIKIISNKNIEKLNFTPEPLNFTDFSLDSNKNIIFYTDDFNENDTISILNKYFGSLKYNLMNGKTYRFDSLINPNKYAIFDFRYSRNFKLFGYFSGNSYVLRQGNDTICYIDKNFSIVKSKIDEQNKRAYLLYIDPNSTNEKKFYTIFCLDSTGNFYPVLP